MMFDVQERLLDHAFVDRVPVCSLSFDIGTSQLAGNVFQKWKIIHPIRSRYSSFSKAFRAISAVEIWGSSESLIVMP